METWRSRWVAGQEAGAAEKAVQFLIVNGHPNAMRQCQKKFSLDKLAVEIDGLAVADSCAAIVEAKPILSSPYVDSYIAKIDELRSPVLAKQLIHYTAYKQRGLTLIEEGAPGTDILSKKRLLPVLAVRTVTTNTAALPKINADLRQNEIEVWLPSGAALGSGDGCYTSPHLHFPDLRPQPALQQAVQQSRSASKCIQASAATAIVRPGMLRYTAMQLAQFNRSSLNNHERLQMRMPWA
ncbi:hypothetical protein MMC07_005708 [Pseudocyphellaria aurata]|nr:hypothetical protein [Pseudocyphellaria aurata]